MGGDTYRDALVMAVSRLDEMQRLLAVVMCAEGKVRDEASKRLTYAAMIYPGEVRSRLEALDAMRDLRDL